MQWIYLLLASVGEICMTFSLGKTKGAEGTEFVLWVVAFVVASVVGMACLTKAVQTIPLGTAYAIWTGIGAVGTVLLGIFVFKESVSPMRLFFLSTLIISLVGLKAVSD